MMLFITFLAFLLNFTYQQVDSNSDSLTTKIEFTYSDILDKSEEAERKKNYEQALTFFIAFSDSIEAALKVDEVKELARIEADIQLKSVQQKQRVNEAERAQILQILIVVLVVFSLSSALLYYSYRINKKKNGEIVRTNRELNILKQRLEEKMKIREKKLKDLQSKLEQYAELNSHEVRAYLVRISGLTGLIQTESEFEVQEITFFIKEIQHSIDKLEDMIRSIDSQLEGVLQINLEQA